MVEAQAATQDFQVQVSALKNEVQSQAPSIALALGGYKAMLDDITNDVKFHMTKDLLEEWDNAEKAILVLMSSKSLTYSFTPYSLSRSTINIPRFVREGDKDNVTMSRNSEEWGAVSSNDCIR